jgi:hypothetical protein
VLYLSRQSYFHDAGAIGVEIATRRDHISPGALGPKYGPAITEHDDPREAAAAAIELADRWRGDAGSGRLPDDCFTIAATALSYPTIADAVNAVELRAWAQARFEAMPKCERCGDVHDVDQWRPIGGGEPVMACSEACAERLLAA